jgi:hypothetical protein
LPHTFIVDCKAKARFGGLFCGLCATDGGSMLRWEE